MKYLLYNLRGYVQKFWRFFADLDTFSWPLFWRQNGWNCWLALNPFYYPDFRWVSCRISRPKLGSISGRWCSAWPRCCHYESRPGICWAKRPFCWAITRPKTGYSRGPRSWPWVWSGVNAMGFSCNVRELKRKESRIHWKDVNPQESRLEITGMSKNIINLKSKNIEKCLKMSKLKEKLSKLKIL